MSSGVPKLLGVPAKYVTLLALVVQNSALILTMRYSRLMPGTPYITSTAVVLSEFIKACTCLCLHLNERSARTSSDDVVESASRSKFSLVRRLASQTRSDVFGPSAGFVKMVFPAVLYTLQDNLQFIAASNLDAATHQVTYQGKILTTALFAVMLLGKKLSQMKWIALLMLTGGVACVQVSSSSSSKTSESPSAVTIVQGNRVVGLTAISCACLTSGLAGVYFEKVLKGGGNTSSTNVTEITSLWIRSLQLSLCCFFLAFVFSFTWDGPAIRANGFFQGYDNPVAVAAVVMQALCGVIVAMVIKYADNILKGFATSISVVLSTIASIFLFGFVVSPAFVGGTAVVVWATYLYGLPDKSKSEAARGHAESRTSMAVEMNESRSAEGQHSTTGAGPGRSTSIDIQDDDLRRELYARSPKEAHTGSSADSGPGSRSIREEEEHLLSSEVYPTAPQVHNPYNGHDLLF